MDFISPALFIIERLPKTKKDKNSTKKITLNSLDIIENITPAKKPVVKIKGKKYIGESV